MPMSPRFMAPAVALGLIVIAGCGGGGDDPRPSPSPPPSSPTTTAPVVPTMPPEAQQNTRKGAVAFVKHYIELLNYAQATGEVSDLRSASSSDCQSCSTTARRLEELYEGGGSLDGGEIKFIDDLTDHNAAEKTWLVTVRVEYAPQIVHNIDGSTQNLDGSTRTHDFVVGFRDSHWMVFEWSRIS